MERPKWSSGLDGQAWMEHRLVRSGVFVLEMGRLDAYPDEILLWVGGELTIYRISTKNGAFLYS